MTVFSKLDPDIIKFHILPRLDGQTLIILSSVSSQFRRLIYGNNNSDLWRNICTTTWPSLLSNYPFRLLFQVISIFPRGYRGFYSDAFPSIHPPKIPYPPPRPPLDDTFFFYATDVFLHDEPMFSVHTYQLIVTGQYTPHPLVNPRSFLCPLLHNEPINKKFFSVKKEGFAEYLEQELTMSCVVIDPHGLRAASLFSFGCKPVLVKRTIMEWKWIQVVYETLLPGLSGFYTELVKCRVEFRCEWDDKDRFHVTDYGYIKMEDMNGKPVWGRHAAVILLNAIRNAERMKKQIN